jgi:hypothetical protein
MGVVLFLDRALVEQRGVVGGLKYMIMLEDDSFDELQ